MADFLEHRIREQSRPVTTYAEPYAGGAGAALHLLHRNVVKRVALNDLNSGIAQFWLAVFFQTDRMVKRVREVVVDLATWSRQREIYLDDAADPFERGFATFFLNRTNRSGILGARPIGGLEQTGPWKLDARYSHEALATRISYLGSFRERVSISQREGRDFLAEHDLTEGSTFFYVDPPYLKQGEDLYLANMNYRDHLELARRLQRLTSPWVLTYDLDSRIPDELYVSLACAEFSISHTAARQHVGREYLVAPRQLRVSSLKGFGPRPGSWLPGRSPDEMYT